MFLQNATIQYSSEYSVVLYRNFSATIQTVKSTQLNFGTSLEGYFNLLNPGARNFAHYTVLNTWYSDLLLPGIIGQLFAKVWVIYETT